MLQASEQGAESKLVILGLGSVRGGASPGETVVGDMLRLRRQTEGGDYSGGAEGRGSRDSSLVGGRAKKEGKFGPGDKEGDGGLFAPPSSTA
jgi:hypothetical protein